IGPSGERLAWVTGPEGQLAPPRPPRDIEGASPPTHEPEVASSVNAWTSDPGQNDRVPTDLALSYAAATQPDEAPRPAHAAPIPLPAPPRPPPRRQRRAPRPPPSGPA